MNRSFSGLILSAITLSAFFVAPAQASEDSRLFELRVYHAPEGKLEDLLARFRDHTTALFEKHGMENIGYWTPLENEDNLLVYLLAYPDEQARDKAWEGFLSDPDWQEAYAASREDGPLVTRIDSTLLETTDYSPMLRLTQEEPARLFELRTYKATPGNLDELDARFLDHTLALFERQGMENIVYFHLTDGQEGADNTLVYLLAHPSEKARDAAFKAFGADPDWQRAHKASEKRVGGSLTEQGGVGHQFLVPTDFSNLK